jgi:hypothetical protein
MKLYGGKKMELKIGKFNFTFTVNLCSETDKFPEIIYISRSRRKNVDNFIGYEYHATSNEKECYIGKNACYKLDGYVDIEHTTKTIVKEKGNYNE